MVHTCTFVAKSLRILFDPVRSHLGQLTDWKMIVLLHASDHASRPSDRSRQVSSRAEGGDQGVQATGLAENKYNCGVMLGGFGDGLK